MSSHRTHSRAAHRPSYLTTRAVSMVEHASCRAPLHMGRPALLLLLLSVMWVVSVPARPSLRPSSPDEFRKLLLWAQRAAERGDVEPAYPSAEQLNEVDKIWTKTHKKGYQQDAELIGLPYRPYVEASDFRRRRPVTEESTTPEATTTESVPVTRPVEKRIFTKKVDHTRSKPISETLAYVIDDGPDAEKKLETLSHAAIVYANESVDKGTKKVSDSVGEASSSLVKDSESPSQIPHEWGPPVLSEDLIGASVSRLPSYEEYDRNERYSHSILHGFTGF